MSADQANPVQPGAPTVPSNLRVLSSSSQSITLAWDASVSATGIEEYIIEMKTGSGAFEERGTTAGSECRFSCSGLNPQTSYTFRVRAKEASSSGVVSDWSEELTASTPAAKSWTQPFAAQENAAITKVWKIKFNAPVSANTLDNIYVGTDADGLNKVSGVQKRLESGNPCVVEVSPPAGGWNRGTAYYLFIDDGVGSGSGQKLSSPVRFRFVTAP